MKSFTATTGAVVIFALVVAQYQPNSARVALQKLNHALNKYSVSNFKPGNAAGIFAQDCRWRDAPPSKPATRGAFQGFWDIRHYEYWNESTQTWSTEQPAACILQTVLYENSLLGGTNKENNNPSSKRRCVGNEYCVFQNLWYNQGKFYYLTDNEDGMVRL
jgi:hypothetical protein